MSGREEEQKTTKGTRDEDEGETPEDQLINLQQRRCPPPNQCVCVCVCVCGFLYRPVMSGRAN